MTDMTVLPRSRPLTRADFERIRDEGADDGRRYELVDGALIVTPSPSYDHQSVVGQLHLRLCAACPPELRVLLAPFDVALDDDTVMQPDLLVARRTSFTRTDLPCAPLLAVEVLSPSTRHIDLGLKRSRFEEAGVAAYWVVDPLALRIRAYELHEGRYDEVADVSDAQELRTAVPFPISLSPDDLRD